MKRFLEEARRMIRLNSVTPHGNEELANFCSSLVSERGFKLIPQQVTHSIDNFSKRQFNVIGVLGDPLVDRKIRKGILLCSHLDTASPGLLESWTETGGDPFAATVKEGKIFGLGSASAKLDFLCKLHAAAKFRERKLRHPIYLVGTCGKEVGMFGARYLIKANTLNPRFVLVGGPTELKAVYSHKSSHLYRVAIGYQQIERDARGFNRRIDLHGFGRSAHGSTPSLGVNAIQESFDFLQRSADNGFELRFTRFDGGDAVNKVPDRSVTQFYLTSHQFEDFKRFFREIIRADGKEKAFRVELGGVGDTGVKFLPDPLFPCMLAVVGFFKAMGSDFTKVTDGTFDPPHSTVNFGRLRQGLSGIELHFDARLLPDLVPEEIEKHVQQGVQKIAANYPSLNLSVARERVNPALKMAGDHEFVKICEGAMEDAGLTPATSKKSYATEAAQFHQAGYESVVFGPGAPIGNTHGPNEHNSLEELEKAIEFYEKVIERVCQ